MTYDLTHRQLRFSSLSRRDLLDARSVWSLDLMDVHVKHTSSSPTGVSI